MGAALPRWRRRQPLLYAADGGQLAGDGRAGQEARLPARHPRRRRRPRGPGRALRERAGSRRRGHRARPRRAPTWATAWRPSRSSAVWRSRRTSGPSGSRSSPSPARRRSKTRPSSPPRRSPSTPASSCSTTARPAGVYPLLTLRQNIYTDPQKPIQVEPGLYEIGAPGADSPLLVTTNFSLTYFTVSGEVEGAGMPAWLLVADADGLSVLTTLGGRQVRRREDRQDGQGVRRRRQARRTRSWSSPATWPRSPARSRRSCRAGRSWSARARRSTSRAT